MFVKRDLIDMSKKISQSNQNSIDAMKLKEQETADASILFQKRKRQKKQSKRNTQKQNEESATPLGKKFSLFMHFWGKKLLLAFVILLLGFGIGQYVASTINLSQNNKTVAIRVGESPEHIDYDLLAAINFLKYSFERNGFKVDGISYIGNLYPEELNKAEINVFVRGFAQFFDLRMNKDKLNMFYVHRYANFYAEEFQNFDLYLSSQRKIVDAVTTGVTFNFLPQGFVPHEPLKPQKYAYDILYIYEYYNPIYYSYMNQNHRLKVYGGSKFASLSEEEKRDELAKAKVVVYEMGNSGADDETYVPYAVWDLISYGRPVVTNQKLLLSSYFQNNVWLFDNVENMILATNRALNTSDEIREKKALQARTVLYDFFDTNVSIMQKIDNLISNN